MRGTVIFDGITEHCFVNSFKKAYPSNVVSGHDTQEKSGKHGHIACMSAGLPSRLKSLVVTCCFNFAAFVCVCAP